MRQARMHFGGDEFPTCAALPGRHPMSMYKTYKPAGIGEPYGSYVHAIEPPLGSRIVFLSGQIPVRADGSVPDGIEAQATVCWENLAAILKDAGLGLENIVRTTQYLVDNSMYKES